MSVPVIANGDIKNENDIKKICELTGVNGKH